MGLFSSPVAVSDGSATRTYSAFAPLRVGKTTTGMYDESAAAVSRQSRINVKTTKTGDTVHALVGVNYAHDVTVDEVVVLKQQQWNLTYHGSDKIDPEDAQVTLNILLALAAEADFVNLLIRGNV
jgi:hypothetical protein